MAKKSKRYLKSDFGARKRPLPKALEFLKGFNFHSVIEDSSGEKIKRTIEVKPASLRKLIQKAESANEISQKFDELFKENEELKQKLEAASEHLQKLEHNYGILMERLNEKPVRGY